MAKRRRGERRDSRSSLNELMDRLSAHLSQDEIRKIFGRSLLALDPAGIERMAAGLERDTAKTVKKLLRPAQKARKTSGILPTPGKTLQEWNAAWGDWDDCVSETFSEGGKYVLQEHHWEPPYLDRSALAEDLEPIAARLHALFPRVLERNLAPDFSFAQALRDTASEIGGNSEDVEDSGEGLAFGPEVTRCLLDWEWSRALRNHRGAFEFLDGICALEHAGEELCLDASTIGSFVSALDSGTQKEMLQGMVENRRSGHWARALQSVHGGWFVLYKELCRKWDPGRFLEICQEGVLQDWKLALPLIDDLIARKAFPDAIALAGKAAGSMLRTIEGQAWDPRKGLILAESWFPFGGEKDRALRALLNQWKKAARAVGDDGTACSLDLQLAILRNWTDGDSILQALDRVPSRFEEVGRRIYEDWVLLIASRSVAAAKHEFAWSDHGWIRGLIDAVRGGTEGPAMFRQAFHSWMKETGESSASLRLGFESLAVLTLDLNFGSELRKASATLQRLLSRELKGDRRVTTLRRTWLKRLRAGELLPEVIQFWKHNAARLVPAPEHSSGDYRDCAEWLAVLRDFDPPACGKVVEQWKVTHRRRKNLWKALDRAGLISG